MATCGCHLTNAVREIPGLSPELRRALTETARLIDVNATSGPHLNAHMKFEEEWILPHVPPAVAAKIRDDHERFRAQLRQFGKVVESEYKAHGDYENLHMHPIRITDETRGA